MVDLLVQYVQYPRKLVYLSDFEMCINILLAFSYIFLHLGILHPSRLFYVLRSL